MKACPRCLCVCLCIFFPLFPLVLLDWLGFTLKVADHLRQIARSNGLKESNQPQQAPHKNAGTVNETRVCCTDTVPTSNDWIIFEKEKEKITTQHILIMKLD